MNFTWQSLPLLVQSIDAFLALIATAYVWMTFKQWRRQQPIERSSEERDRAAEAVGSSLTMLTTADSIFIASIGVVLQANSSVNGASTTQMLISGVGFVIAILLGAFSAIYLLNHVHHMTSVAEHPLVIGYAVGQFAFTVVSAAMFVISFFLA